MKKVFSHPKWRSLLKIFLFICLFSTFTFLIRFLDENIFEYNAPYGYFHYPPNRTLPFFRKGEAEAGVIGEFGIRESSQKTKTNCNYMLLGDSQTFGSGIFWEDSFSEILNRETNCQWTNISMPGFTLENEYAIYLVSKNKVQFEHLFLVIYGNDIYETGDTPDFIHFVDKQKWYTQLLGFFLPERTRMYLKKEYFGSVQTRMEKEIEKFANTKYEKHKNKVQKKKSDIEVGDEDFFSFRTLYSISPNYFKESLDVRSVSQKNFRRWKRILEKFHNELNKSNKKLTFVYIPLDVEFDPIRYQVYESIGFPMQSNWLKGDSEFIQELQSISKTFGTNLIDMRFVFRKQKHLLQKEDIHFNEKANRLIADTIKKSL
ncbi:SGNH/GDSL hydrolase family protein [Leptospira sp. WS39.C2]